MNMQKQNILWMKEHQVLICWYTDTKTWCQVEDVRFVSHNMRCELPSALAVKTFTSVNKHKTRDLDSDVQKQPRAINNNHGNLAVHYISEPRQLHSSCSLSHCPFNLCFFIFLEFDDRFFGSTWFLQASKFSLSFSN